MKKFYVSILILIMLFCAYASDDGTIVPEFPITRNFVLQLTKIGTSDFDFCTYDSALDEIPLPLPNGSIDFGLTGDNPKQRTADFGLYWDLYIRESTPIDISLTFSAQQNGSADYMLRNLDTDGYVLNYSVSGNVYNYNESEWVWKQKIEITVPRESIDSSSYTDRTVQVYSKAASAFDIDNIKGAAQFTLTLDAPYAENENGEMGPIDFQGGEYIGYAILTITSGGN